MNADVAEEVKNPQITQIFADVDISPRFPRPSASDRLFLDLKVLSVQPSRLSVESFSSIGTHL
jgi:hypothetical protein